MLQDQQLNDYTTLGSQDTYHGFDDRTDSSILTHSIDTSPCPLTREDNANPFVGHPASLMSVCETTSNCHNSTASVVPEGKNPISEFMEYAQANGKVGRFEEQAKSGPPHRPTFIVCAYMGTSKLGQGTSGNKKAAKRQAAENSLKMLSMSNCSTTASAFGATLTTHSRTTTDKNAGICPAGADPISILNEYAQKSGVELTFPNPDVSGADHQRQFTLSAMIGTTSFPRATASTIQEAKREASREALKQLKQNKQYTPGLSKAYTTYQNIFTCSVFIIMTIK
ncbi:double-stranded RNA-specific adenosine deaminase-like [Pecten maximus]|uniref:double-stranded RNA-specific adenosine deaminase-like n=1 Tax=Pecten maximus TaxID=6579 RepID=UPI0014585B70|nr:double-stranded RNA-specific adenosine deaminase-like [Pecten maximus]XP_033749861.1 double-stranded RNA-specific adenosine deaminase-like [Pecten maximus]